MPVLFWWIIIFATIAGAIFGSFITALVYRARHNRSMNEKHSVCPHCQHPLGWLDLFPILSYIGLRGRCRYCHQAIGNQYVLIEVATAALFGFSSWMILDHALSYLMYFNYNENWLWVGFSLALTWAGLVLLIALFVYDLRWTELPNRWTLGGASLFGLATILAYVLGQPLLWQPANAAGTAATLWQTLISGLASGLFFLGIVLGSEKILRKPGMGMGDVKLGLFMGLLLGFPGIVVALYLAFILGSVISLLLIAGKRAKFGNAVPFGPFLVAGTIISLWLTPIVIDWYNRIWL